MYKIFIAISLLFLSACAVVTTPTSTKPTPSSTDSGSSRSIEERLSSGVKYGSGAHTATLFADFECPACIRFAHSVMPTLESYAASGRLLIVYKQYPLTTIHKNAYRDSLAALCANEQGKYMEYKTAIYGLEEQKSMASVSDDERVALVDGITGIDKTTFSQCLSTDKYKATIDSDMADGDAVGVLGTPTLFFDGKRLDFSVFQSMDQINQFFESRL